MVRLAERQSSFADLELQYQGVGLDNTLQALSDFLDQHQPLVNLVHQDLVRGMKNPATGRGAMDASQVLRSFVLRRVKSWDLRELSERIADGFSLRRFTTFYPVPSHRAFHRANVAGLFNDLSKCHDPMALMVMQHLTRDSPGPILTVKFLIEIKSLIF